LTKSAFSWKFVCRIVHRSSSEGREDGFRGPSGRASGDYMLWWCIKIRNGE